MAKAPRKTPVVQKRPQSETKEQYRKRIMATICSLVAQKQVLTQICQLPDMPCYDTVYQWMNESEELSDMYARARTRRAAARADRIDEITSQVIAGHLDPQAARVVIDAEKWQASKENARVYGDKVLVGGDAENPIKHIHDVSEEALIAIATGRSN